ncbi:AAA-like domain-containing protein [Aetokthonos hydrillicola Thurmond2011]|jgi:hypothetical protein|uniref:AAA-like domain-containing protein n=1 Tax=Aetokthonos hydrillicola Thurmond2011 TaxID=2712845 RepID=A0AAP5MBX6_9CYAN|nr:AAA-like domain-containing protein [Aetokthonos hydrillicola]MBO3461109.1 serine/threonine protein kinase [Aetokthonos hydrillicola CCALA 1050]MBW4590670.1 AAA-like domain-containing protein [Aetokthonos hydrillicola CCALA 1050]MDR9897648.1 AAA-like domain-containing protein [Aetokthonos hydrillicola Thurmond2011]
MNFEKVRKVVEAAIQEHEHRRLNDVELTILRASWEGLTYTDMAKNSPYEASYLKGDVGHKFWRVLSDALKQPVSKRNFRAVLESMTPQSVDLDCDYYIQRPPTEDICYKAILMPGALLRIKAAPKMGKTELMSRLINHAADQGYRAVDLKLRLAEKADFETLDKFLQWFCSSITQMLEIEPDNKVNEHWNKQLGNSKLKCMDYFEDCLLDNNEPPLVLCLDDVDQVYQYPEIAGEFLRLLRTLHEKAKTRPIWKRLGLILTYTKEYPILDINESPFNIGILVELPEFSQPQVEELLHKYNLEWDTDQIQKLMDMIGGHPYLVRETLEHVTKWGLTLEEVLKNAPTEAGIYSDLLQEHLWNLQQNQKNHPSLDQALKHPRLDQALKQVVNAKHPVEIESDLGLKLYELGLVEWQDKSVKPRCELYRQYFQEHLKGAQ